MIILIIFDNIYFSSHSILHNQLLLNLQINQSCLISVPLRLRWVYLFIPSFSQDYSPGLGSYLFLLRKPCNHWIGLRFYIMGWIVETATISILMDCERSHHMWSHVGCLIKAWLITPCLFNLCLNTLNFSLWLMWHVHICLIESHQSCQLVSCELPRLGVNTDSL